MRHLVVVFVLAACNPKPHVRLGPLPPDLAPGQRVQLYNELHATEEHELTRTSCSRTGCAKSVERTLVLANGTPVHHVEDFLPLVHPESAAAHAARASLASRDTSRNFRLLAVAGLVTLAIAFATADPDEGFGSGVKIGVIAGGAAGVIGTAGGYIYASKAADQQGAAHIQYNAGLARQLRVCVSGIFVTPCEASP